MINAATRNWMIKRWYEKVPFEKSSIPCEISLGITRFTPLLNNAKPIRLKIINLYGLSTENMFGLSGFSPGTCLVDLFVIFEEELTNTGTIGTIGFNLFVIPALK